MKKKKDKPNPNKQSDWWHSQIEELEELKSIIERKLSSVSPDTTYHIEILKK